MPKRHALRIAAVQCLFQLDLQGDTTPALTEDFLTAEGLTGKDLDFCKELVEQTWKHRQDIDHLITDTSEHWDLGRLAAIDRAILRLGICELLFLKQTPPKVILNEAVEIAKKFGAAESSQFVNGVMDAIWKKAEAQKEKIENTKAEQ